MISSQKCNSFINRTHEKTLRLCTENENLIFGKLLNHTNSVTAHVMNLLSLLTEVYKTMMAYLHQSWKIFLL